MAALGAFKVGCSEKREMFLKVLWPSLRLRQLVPLTPLPVDPARPACALWVLRLRTRTRTLLRIRSPGWAVTFRKRFLKVKMNSSQEKRLC